MSSNGAPAVQRDGFGSRELSRRDETAEAAVAAAAKATVEARYIMAMRNPRDMDEVRQRLMQECRRPGFAEVARYRKPIGRDYLEGPSIRFAEAAVRCMRNISVDVIVMFDDPDKQIIQVVVTDLEANIPFSDQTTLIKTVERRNAKGRDVVAERVNSYGDTVYVVRATEDEFLNKQRAAVSKIMRTCALRVIPGDLIDEGMAVVVETKAAEVKADPEGARKKIADAFFSIAVKVSDLKEYLGCDLDGASPDQIQELRDIYAAIKDGETTWKAVMELKRDAESSEAPEGNAAKKADESAGKLAEMIGRAETVDALQALAAQVKKAGPKHRAGLTELFDARMQALKSSDGREGTEA